MSLMLFMMVDNYDVKNYAPSNSESNLAYNQNQQKQKYQVKLFGEILITLAGDVYSFYFFLNPLISLIKP